MALPFTTEQFLEVFASYNRSVWPMQIVLLLLALAVLYFAAGGRSIAGRIVSLVLALFWIWMGLVYHLLFFTTVNPGAYLFGIVMIVQGLIFLYYGVLKNSMSFRWKSDWSGITGTVIILYALVLYPMLGFMLGHVYPYSPTFGLPCPTTIFTFGVLLMSERKIPVWMIVIPLLWSLLGFTAALSLGIREDIGLLVAGVVSTTMIMMKNRVFDAPTVDLAA